MALRVRLFILACSIVFFSGSLAGEQIRLYQGSASAPILENDIAFAKQNAFQKAQHAILDTAIRDLLDPGVYDANQSQILRNQSLRPRYHLISVTILNETSGESEFNIEIAARVQMDTLEDELRKMGMVFRNCSWFQLTLLIEKGIEIDTGPLREKLAPFHIELSNVGSIDYTGISIAERNSKVFIEDLFLNYKNQGVIYILETTLTEVQEKAVSDSGPFNAIFGQNAQREDPKVSGIQLRIIRRADLEELNRISLSLPQPLDADSDQLATGLSDLIPKLFSLLTVGSVKRNLYEGGLAATYNIEISGLNSPYLRSVFEHQVLKERRSISSYTPVQLSQDRCRYVLRSGMTLTALAEDLLQPNPFFELLVEHTEFNTIVLSAFYQYTATGVKPGNWQADEGTVQEIRDIISPPVPDGENTSEAAKANLNSYYIPAFSEVEPNNSILQFNSIPASVYVLGEVSSRADEDIFELRGVEINDEQLEKVLFSESVGTDNTPSDPRDKSGGSSHNGPFPGNNAAKTRNEAPAEELKPVAAPLPLNAGKDATVYIDWIQFGKTSLAPQLKLYDENFNFINAFNLFQTQKRLRFHYTFPNPPERIYLRISDRIGFIQGETGGFKRYRYLIRYSWNKEDAAEPENPLITDNSELAERP